MRDTEAEQGHYDPLTTTVELWPVAADQDTMWLLSGNDAWRTGVIRRDTEVHRAVEDLLRDKFTLDATRLLHSPSWRQEGDTVILTYIAVIESAPPIDGEWVYAQRITPELIDSAGKPLLHGPAEPPTPRYIDVLTHAVRHLRFLLETDAQARSGLDEKWRAHLHAIEPALSGMYQ